MVSRATASQRRFWGSFRFNLNMNSAGKEAVRLRARHPGDQTTLFELVELNNNLKIYIGPARTYFEGEIPPDGSPFRSRFGVEPWDLGSIITIGQRLAQGAFNVEHKRWTFRLVPSAADAAGDGLAEAELDKTTGLPRSALWRRGDRQWTVDYEAWDVFNGYGQAEKLEWLMPTRFTVHSKSPRAIIEIEKHPTTEGPQYRIDTLPDTFEMKIPAGTARGSLEDFDRVLSGDQGAKK